MSSILPGYTRSVMLIAADRYEGYLHHHLGPVLESFGISCCLHNRDFYVGDPTAQNWMKFLDNCRFVLLFLTPDLTENEWNEFGALYEHSQHPNNRSGRIIPIRVEKLRKSSRNDLVPKLVSMLNGIEWSSQYARAYFWERLFGVLGVHNYQSMLSNYKRHMPDDLKQLDLPNHPRIDEAKYNRLSGMSKSLPIVGSDDECRVRVKSLGPVSFPGTHPRRGIGRRDARWHHRETPDRETSSGPSSSSSSSGPMSSASVRDHQELMRSAPPPILCTSTEGDISESRSTDYQPRLDSRNRVRRFRTPSRRVCRSCHDSCGCTQVLAPNWNPSPRCHSHGSSYSHGSRHAHIPHPDGAQNLQGISVTDLMVAVVMAVLIFKAIFL